MPTDAVRAYAEERMDGLGYMANEALDTLYETAFEEYGSHDEAEVVVIDILQNLSKQGHQEQLGSLLENETQRIKNLPIDEHDKAAMGLEGQEFSDLQSRRREIDELAKTARAEVEGEGEFSRKRRIKEYKF